MQGKAEVPHADSPTQYGTPLLLRFPSGPDGSTESLHLHLKVAAAFETQLSLAWFRDQLPFGINYTLLAGKSTKNSLLGPP